MLKTRVIPILLIRGNAVVKSTQFSDHRMVGDAATNVKVFSSRKADEMVIVDIDAYQRGDINLPLIKRLSSLCNMPLSIGGGVKSIEDASDLFQCGADKVVVNTAFYHKPGLITEIAKSYGNQAVVFSLDAMFVDGKYVAFSNGGTQRQGLTAIDAARKAVDLGAGEILINSIDQDGMMEGYEVNLIQQISDSVNTPVIAAGGCGKKEHCLEALNSKASAIAAGSIFYWVGESIITLKEYLNAQGIEMRLR